MSKKRALLPFTILILSFTAVAFRLFFLQVWHHAELSERVRRMVSCRVRPENPCRGMIFDREGRVLAMSLKTYTFFADPHMIKNPLGMQTALRSVDIPLSLSALRNAGDSSYVPLAKNIDDTAMHKIKGLKLEGTGFESQYQREYPEGRLACHLLGLVGKDGSGLEGIELTANAYLTGEKVKQMRYRDARGREITDKLVDPEDMRGADVSLTIDRNLQFIAEQEIDRVWKDSRSKNAMVIIQDPNSGEILALSCRPDYDPGNPSASLKGIRNPAVCDIFEPGSTFKMVTISGALEDKIVTPSENIFCENGKYRVMNHTISDHEKKGMLTVAQVMECSSNIGTAKIGQRLGRENLYRYIRQFGFFSPTGIDLPGEAKGLLKKPEQWSGLSVPVISFGQEIGVTALQLINAYSSIANGGTLLEPHIVKEVRSPGGETIYRSDRRAIRRTVSAGTAETMRDILRGVVERGTGVMAKVPGYTVGGKTGTAQKRDPLTGRYSSSAYVTSFCGMIPANKPRLTIYVVIDEPRGDYWASSLAAPVFSRIAGRAMNYMQVPPDNENVRVCKVPSYALLMPAK